MSTPNPFRRSAERRFDFDLEFRIFQEKAPALIEAACERLPRFIELERMFSFYVYTDRERPRGEMGIVQAHFGSRSMFRVDVHKKLGVESDLSLLYSQGPTGEVAVSLFPFASNLARTHETRMLLRVGWFTAHQLGKAIRSDVAALVAYGYSTTLDAEPTLKEKMMVWYLRRTRSMEVDGKPTEAKSVWGYAFSLLLVILKQVVSAIFKPVGIIITVITITALGYPYLADYLKHP